MPDPKSLRQKSLKTCFPWSDCDGYEYIIMHILLGHGKRYSPRPNRLGKKLFPIRPTTCIIIYRRILPEIHCQKYLDLAPKQSYFYTFLWCKYHLCTLQYTNDAKHKVTFKSLQSEPQKAFYICVYTLNCVLSFCGVKPCLTYTF